MIQRYLGNKNSIIGSILNEVSLICEPGDKVCDIFSGTLSVSMALKRSGYKVISNDINKFSYSFGVSYLINNSIPIVNLRPLGVSERKYDVGVDNELLNIAGSSGFIFLNDKENYNEYRNLAVLINYLNQLTSVELQNEFHQNYFYDTYTPEGKNSYFKSLRGTSGNRQFFTPENGAKIDLILNKIRFWKKNNLLSDVLYSMLVSILAESVEKISNTQGTFHDFPRNTFDSRALKKITLKLPPLDDVISTNQEHILGKERDSLEFIKEVDSHKLIYIDPPYNFRQYTSYYFMLNLICDYCEMDDPEEYFRNVEFVRGQNLDKDFKSTFCQSKLFIPSIETLISEAKTEYVLMSYFNGRNHTNNTIPKKDVNGVDMIESFFNGPLFESGSFQVKPIKRVNYQSFNGHKAHELDEYLFIAKKEELKMIWFSKINSHAFKDWLINSGGGHSIRPGKALDPFGSSMRKFNNAHAWMAQIATTGTLVLSTPRAIDQGIIDLRSAHLVDQSNIALSVLGTRTYSDFLKFNIPESDPDYEVHRCLVIINNALKLKDSYYQNFLNYWVELRKSYTFNHLITVPEHLYFFSFFNKNIGGFNPYDVIKALSMTDVDFPSIIDWNSIKSYYNDATLNPVVDKYQITIDGIVARQGRTNFVAALELIKTPSSLDVVTQALNISPNKVSILQAILKELGNYNMPALNQILYGPPGTGKTHNSINHALAIINGIDVTEMISAQNADPSLRGKAKKEFDELVKKGQIQFVTFHQSYSYEDFVEGIKSVVNSSGVIEYRVEDGIFKNICTEAGKKGAPSVSFDDAYDSFTQEVQDSGGQFSLQTPIQKKNFGVKISSLGNAVAVPKTDDATEMTISKSNLKGYIEHGVVKDWKPYTTAIGDYIKGKYLSTSTAVDNSDKNYVLIIDEINRGNISKIFGELITLIEKSKRLGESEELRVKLTYSGADSMEDFGVPNNLYMIGTMNSADKSISLVDTAIRRRFEFFEYSGDSNILSNNVDGIDMQQLLWTINSRIEVLLDKDHKIGHAYFIHVNTKNELCAVFRNKIIPLLEEYFYSDYEKIQLVLGDNPEFNKVKENRMVIGSASNDQRNLFGKDIDGFEEKIIYHINSNIVEQRFDLIEPEFFISIYKKTSVTA